MTNATSPAGATGRLAGSATETAAEIRERGGNAEAFGCDVQDDDDLVALIMGTRDRLGSVDLLVNNPALTVPGRVGAPPPAVSPGRTAPPAATCGVQLKDLCRYCDCGR